MANFETSKPEIIAKIRHEIEQNLKKWCEQNLQALKLESLIKSFFLINL